MGLFGWLFGRKGQRGATRMAISPAFLPPELHYIIPLAELHGSEARVAHFDHRLGRHVKYAENLSPEAIEPLRKLYTEIRAKNHGLLINRWHHGHSGKNTCPAETTWPVYGLLCLFAQLSELGIPPFNDSAVRPMEFREELDWSKLPPSLRYLAGPAEVYGGYQFENRIMDFLQTRMTPDERVELQALSIRYGEDYEGIERWLDEYRMTQHREAALVYFTGMLLGLGSDAGLL
jgi:hypothetical protein